MPAEGRPHEPVMVKEAMEGLGLRSGHRAVDCTTGAGGHAEEILKRIGVSGTLVAIDCDPEAIGICERRLEPYKGQVRLVRDDFRNIKTVLNNLGLKQVDAILVDCGVSSMQLENAVRGFSFQHNGPLDMRMDPSKPETVKDILKTSSEKELADIFHEYGEERFAKKIAHVVKIRYLQGQICDTKSLADAVVSGVGRRPYERGRIHPATRVFQALRIRLNDELCALREVLKSGIECLSPGGRMGVIAFHSLEDRIVKFSFRQAEAKGLGRQMHKKPVRPSAEECAKNPRSRSARLRIFERKKAEGETA